VVSALGLRQYALDHQLPLNLEADAAGWVLGLVLTTPALLPRRRPAGSLGYASVLRSDGNSVMTTSATGMPPTNDAELVTRVRHLSTQAQQPVTHPEHTKIVYGYCLSSVLAALGPPSLPASMRSWRDAK
jgi:hypothetical protein